MKRKKSKYGLKNVITTITAVLVFITALASVMTLLGGNELNNEKTQKEVTVYFVPGDIWLEDDSTMGAWVWNDYGVPQSKFIVASDEDGDDVYEVTFSEEYTSILFVDLVPNATELGGDWKNKRSQTDNQAVPKDKNVYYHQYSNEWSDTSELLFVVTTEDTTVYLEPMDWTCDQSPVVYYFDKTGKNEPNFVKMTQCGSKE